MPAPKSPITVLAESLAQMPVLKGFSGGVKVLAGKNFLVAGRSPPSIVIFPIEAGYQSANDNVESLVDIDLKLVAHIWAKSLDETWDLRQRYVQALRDQAIGNPSQPIKATEGQAGFFLQFLTEAWDLEPDTAEAGQEMEVVVSIRLSAAPTIQLGTGQIDATGIDGIQTPLTAPLTVNAASASVDSTAKFPAAGTLSIDSEQIAYTGTTPTTFTGLTRGANGTTAATHAVDAVAWSVA